MPWQLVQEELLISQHKGQAMLLMFIWEQLYHGSDGSVSMVRLIENFELILLITSILKQVVANVPLTREQPMLLWLQI